MGVLYDYFAASTDERAASVIDRVGGPSAAVQTPAKQPHRQGLFRRRKDQPAERAGSVDATVELFDSVDGKSIEPVVQLGTLEELLTGRPFDEIIEDPRSGHAVAERDGGNCLVLTLPDTLTMALASSTDERLAQVAVPWSETEEFWGQGDPADLAQFLQQLAALARRAKADGDQLYCWVSV